MWHFRLKAEIDRKDLEREESISRLSSKYQNEFSDLKYHIQELEMSKKELQNEINLFKVKQNEEDSIEELRTSLSQLRNKLEQEERRNYAVIEENDRLKDDQINVSNWSFVHTI